MKFFKWMSDAFLYVYFYFRSNQIVRFFVLLGFLYILTFIIIVKFSGSFAQGNFSLIWSNAMAVAGAATVCGFLIGFLFGIPRSVRYGFNKNGNGNPKLSEDTYYADNTNLEEISDWITKIIVGLSLTQYREIVKQVENIASNVAKSFPASGGDLYVFSYSLLVMNFGFGFFGAYYWARTRFISILAESRVALMNITNALNRNLSNINKDTEEANTEKSLGFTFQELKLRVNELLNKNAVKDATDTQKNRWGNQPSNNNRVLRASVKPHFLPKLFNVTIEVVSTSADTPLDKMVVILLDRTFPEEVVYVQPEKNIAKITVVAYEAFTVAALCDDGKTQLELDLQEVKGYPVGFYYK